MKELYDVTRTVSKKIAIRSRPVKSKERELLANKQAQLDRWREHFIEMLNREDEEQQQQQDAI